MIFVLAFFIVIGFFLMRFGKKSFVKSHHRYLLSKIKNKVFFEKKWELTNLECKSLIGEFSQKRIKQIDNVLSRVRYNCPKSRVGVEILADYGIVLPIFLMKNGISKTQSEILEQALKFENFCVVVFDSNVKETAKNYPKFHFFDQNNKQLLFACKSLNVNFSIGLIKFDNSVCGLNWKYNQKNKMISSSYFLTKTENKNFCVYEYNFFIGQKICAIVVQNKQNNVQSLNFDYMFDLADKQINYHSFFRHTHHIVCQPILDEEQFCVCYSVNPSVIRTSLCLGVEQSNLPCVKLSYMQTFKPKQSKTFVFSKSNQFQPLDLSLHDFERLSFSYMSGLFFADIILEDFVFNNFFNEKLKNKAMQEIFESGEQICVCAGSLRKLIDKYNQGELTASTCYFSIQALFVRQKSFSYVLNPFALSGNYKIKIWTGENYKTINFCKKNLEKPCLVVDKVCYAGQFEIAKKHLITSNQIEIQY